uniref:Tc1-like transposase DDE domain-containing protein n=1 Tax=Stegastes partitus TaxID=144197 RepID=A0A3B5ACP2_9TELE
MLLVNLVCLKMSSADLHQDTELLVQDIIETIIIPQFHQHTPNFLFMDDNAPPHRARIVTTRLQEVGVPHMVWPAMSHDLNPIEQVWDQLKQRLDDLIEIF